MTNILLYGVGSTKNKGCEALIESTISQFSENDKITVATFDYEYNKKHLSKRINKIVNHHIHNEEEFTPKMKKQYELIQNEPFDYNNYEWLFQHEVIDEMKKSDICIHIGGDNYCYGANEWMYSINNKAEILNKKTVLWGASLYDEINDPLLIQDLNKYSLLLIRESLSYNALIKYISKEKMMLVPDPAFSLPKKEVKLDKWYENRKIIGLNLSPLTIKDEEKLNCFVKLINYILDNTDYSINLIPHVTLDESNDIDVLIKIKDIFSKEDRVYFGKNNYNCSEIKYVISKCDMFIAARTHASIAAYSTLVPTLVIGYSVKSKGIAYDLFGNYKDYVIPFEHLTEDNLIKRFNFLLKNKNEIKYKLSKIIPSFIKKSSKLYELMNQKFEELDKKEICSKNKCIGCGVCANICPQKAITLQENEEHFIYPVIDLKKCVNCGLCRKMCPSISKNPLNNAYIPKCYAVKNKDVNVLLKSSSGGVFYNLAVDTINNNGVVYGCVLENFKANHIRVTTIDDIEKLLGSKYIQSNINIVLKDIEKDLETGVIVLFSGTPCQVLALKKFLNKEYSNLYCISVICHGVSNEYVIKNNIKELNNKFKTNFTSMNFKSKNNGWDNPSFEYISDSVAKTYKFTEDNFYSLFLKNYILRESCYNCPAKGIENNFADIILGDYWGVMHVHPEIDYKKGCSCVIIKSKKGEELFDNVSSNFLCKKTKLSSIIKYNSALDHSVEKPEQRSIIFNYINSYGIDGTNKIISQNEEIKELKLKLSKPKNEIDNSVLVSKDCTINEQQNRISVLEDELSSIKNSKRYRYVNGIANRINKIRRKK